MKGIFSAFGGQAGCQFRGSFPVKHLHTIPSISSLITLWPLPEHEGRSIFPGSPIGLRKLPEDVNSCCCILHQLNIPLRHIICFPLHTVQYSPIHWNILEVERCISRANVPTNQVHVGRPRKCTNCRLYHRQLGWRDAPARLAELVPNVGAPKDTTGHINDRANWHHCA